MDKHHFKVPNAIFTSSLTKYELLVVVYLLSCRNDDGQIIIPDHESIARCCAISGSKTKKVINDLSEKGIIRKQSRSQSYRKNHSSSYVIALKNNTVLKT